MKDTDTITIYWTSTSYKPDEESWTMIYKNPVSLSSELRSKKNDGFSGMFICPATNDFLKNIFVFKSAITDKHTLPIPHFSNPPFQDKVMITLPTDGNIRLYTVRPSSLKGYSNILYNMSWLLFADEPVVAKFTAPFCPPTLPSSNAILSPGQFDIGKWYRPYHLDYHIPSNVDTFEIIENDHLFYLDLQTEKKVLFKKYMSSPKLETLAKEASASPDRYGRFKSLKERYLMAKESNYTQQVLTEIKKNLVED